MAVVVAAVVAVVAALIVVVAVARVPVPPAAVPPLAGAVVIGTSVPAFGEKNSLEMNPISFHDIR